MTYGERVFRHRPAKILIHTKREARDANAQNLGLVPKILIHTKREARDHSEITAGLLFGILIHTKREARDEMGPTGPTGPQDFNPHEARSS